MDRDPRADVGRMRLPGSGRWVNICAGQLLVCPGHAPVPNSQLSHGVEQPENPVNNWENVLIECGFINLPINLVSRLQGLLLAVSSLSDCWHQVCRAVKGLPKGFRAGFIPSAGFQELCCVSGCSRTHMGPGGQQGGVCAPRSHPK